MGYPSYVKKKGRKKGRKMTISNDFNISARISPDL